MILAHDERKVLMLKCFVSSSLNFLVLHDLNNVANLLYNLKHENCGDCACYTSD